MATKAHKAQKLILSFKPHHTGLWLQRSFNEAHMGALNNEEREVRKRKEKERKLFTWGSWKGIKKGERKKRKEKCAAGGRLKKRKERKKKDKE
jgi:hypothetical protein